MTFDPAPVAGGKVTDGQRVGPAGQFLNAACMVGDHQVEGTRRRGRAAQGGRHRPTDCERLSGSRPSISS